MQNLEPIKNGYRRLLNYPYGLKPSPVQMANGKEICFEDTLICLKDSSLLQAFVRELEGIYHFSSDRFIKDRIRLRTNKLVSQENTDIHGSGTCEGDSGEFLAKKDILAYHLSTKRNIPLYIL